MAGRIGIGALYDAFGAYVYDQQSNTFHVGLVRSDGRIDGAGLGRGSGSDSIDGTARNQLRGEAGMADSTHPHIGYRQTLHFRFFLTAFVVGLLPLILSWLVSYLLIARTIQQRAEVVYEQDVQNAFSDLREQVRDLFELMLLSAENPALSELASNVDFSQPDASTFRTTVLMGEYLAPIALGLPGVSTAIMTEESGYYLHDWFAQEQLELQSADWFEDLYEADSPRFASSAIDNVNPYAPGATMAVAGTRILGSQAWIVAFLDARFLEPVRRLGLNPEISYAVYASGGTLLDTYASDGTSVFPSNPVDVAEAFEADKLAATIHREPLSGMTVVVTSPRSLFRRETLILSLTIATIVVILAVAVAFAAFLTSKRVSSPIHDLYERMRMVADGDLRAESPVRGVEEVRFICEGFNTMLSEIRELVKRARSVEIVALQSQVSPHFISNTLACFQSQIRPYSAEISESLAAFNRLIGSSFRTTDSDIALRDEIESNRDYIRLLNLRYGGLVRDEWEIEDSASETLVPPLMLQPLLENAVMHGISGQLNGGRLGTIRVEARCEAHDLVVDVMDDGVGLSRAAFDRALETPGSDHIGISNVHRRLQLRHGTEYGIDLVESARTGTCVRVRLPRGNP